MPQHSLIACLRQRKAPYLNVMSRVQNGVAEIFTLPGCYTVLIGGPPRVGTTFWSHLKGTSSTLNLEDATQGVSKRRTVTVSGRCVTSHKSGDYIT